jgi:hypothetical protein
MRLCKDCKYFQEASDKEAFCSHEQAIKYDDPIYGNHSKKTCSEMRMPDNASCGRLGRLWTVKPGFMLTEHENM